MNYVQFHKSFIGRILRKCYKYLSDRKYIESAAAAGLGYKIDLENPRTYNEKLAWIKLYDHNPIYHKMVDKYEVKAIVDNIIGEGHTAKCYGVWDDISEVDFSKLPSSFVIKSTHYGQPVIVKNKAEMKYDIIAQILKKQSKTSGYDANKEWGYKDVKPRVMIEEYLEDDSDNNVLQDYKFWCFNGTPKVMYLTVKDKLIYENFYDMDFNIVNIDHGFPRRQPEFQKPQNFEDMKNYAAKLSDGIPFVRVDFYNINGKVYFGELTFYDWGGAHPFVSYEQDLMIGEWLTLPSEKRI